MVSPEMITVPRYLKIAVDLSARIASGSISEGTRLKGRSVLSTEYQVSPETIRRAVAILSDKKVVETNIGSGIVVTSRKKAIEFIHSFQDDESVNDLRRKLGRLFEQRRSLEEEITATTRRIIDLYTYRRTDLIKPVEIAVPDDSPVIGKSIGQLEVWHNTGATIIGIMQQADLILSPGPYYEFGRGDRVLIVGNENVIKRFNVFLRCGAEN